MNDNVGLFWEALGVLTFAETVRVAEAMRDAYDCTSDFEPADIHEWSFLLNAAREIAQSPAEQAA